MSNACSGIFLEMGVMKLITLTSKAFFEQKKGGMFTCINHLLFCTFILYCSKIKGGDGS